MQIAYAKKTYAKNGKLNLRNIRAEKKKSTWQETWRTTHCGWIGREDAKHCGWISAEDAKHCGWICGQGATHCGRMFEVRFKLADYNC